MEEKCLYQNQANNNMYQQKKNVIHSINKIFQKQQFYIGRLRERLKVHQTAKRLHQLPKMRIQ